MLYIPKIVSGGQTGADRAALDWAIHWNIAHGGWCPRGRIAEDGVLANRYKLVETPSSDYAERTEWNVCDSDATVILSMNTETFGGTELTTKLAIQHGKPYIHLTSKIGVDTCASRLRRFTQKHKVRVLNVAGPRESEEPKLFTFVTKVLCLAYTVN